MELRASPSPARRRAAEVIASAGRLYSIAEASVVLGRDRRAAHRHIYALAAAGLVRLHRLGPGWPVMVVSALAACRDGWHPRLCRHCPVRDCAWRLDERVSHP